MTANNHQKTDKISRKQGKKMRRTIGNTKALKKISPYETKESEIENT